MPLHSFSYARRSFTLEGLRDNDYIFGQIRHHNRFYEIQFLRYLRSLRARLARQGTVAVDVGANIGNHAVFFGSFVASSVVCVEPNGELLPILSRNLKRHVDRFSIFAGGLGERPGVASLRLPPGAEGNVGAAMLDLDRGEIEVTTLDGLLQDLRSSGQIEGRVAFIKIDVEGMELPVLKGAAATLQAEHPHLFVEAATDAHFQVLCQHLQPLGYQPLLSWGATPLWHFAFKPDLGVMARAKTWRAARSLRWHLWQRWRPMVAPTPACR